MKEILVKDLLYHCHLSSTGDDPVRQATARGVLIGVVGMLMASSSNASYLDAVAEVKRLLSFELPANAVPAVWREDFSDVIIKDGEDD